MASIFPNQSSQLYGDLSKVSNEFFGNLQKRFGDTGEQFRNTFGELEDILKKTQARMSKLEFSKQMLNAGQDILRAQQSYLKGLKEEGVLLDKNAKKIFDNGVKTRSDSMKKLSNLKKERDYIQGQIKQLDQSKVDKSSPGYKNIKQSFQDHLRRISTEKKAANESFNESQNQIKIISKKKLDNAKDVAKAEGGVRVAEGGVALSSVDSKQQELQAARSKIHNSVAKAMGLPDIGGIIVGAKQASGALEDAGMLSAKTAASVEDILVSFEGLILPLAMIVGFFGLGFSRMIKLNEEASKFNKTTGLIGENAKQFTGGMDGQNFNLIQTNLLAHGLNASLEDVEKTSEEIYKTFGYQSGLLNKANDGTVQLVTNVLTLNKKLGISTDSALGFYKNIMSSAHGSESIGNVWIKSLYNIAKASDNIKGSMFSINDVMDDIAKASGRTVAAFRGNTSEMIKSAIAARQYGSNLESVADSAYSIMDFQKTITADQTVSALTGKNINFDKFNMATLQGDGKGSMEALTGMMTQMGGFVNQSLYTQQAFSEATGKSIDDLVNIDRTNNLKKNLTNKADQDQFDALVTSQTSIADQMSSKVDADQKALTAAQNNPDSTANQIQDLQNQLSKDSGADLQYIQNQSSIKENAETLKNNVFTTLANTTLPLFQKMLPYLQDVYNYFTGNWADSVDRIKSGGLQSKDDMDILLKHSTNAQADITEAIHNTKNADDRNRYIQGGNYQQAMFGEKLNPFSTAQSKAYSTVDNANQTALLAEKLKEDPNFSMKDKFGDPTMQGGGRRQHMGYSAQQLEMWKEAQDLAAKSGTSDASVQQQGNDVAPTPATTPTDTEKSNYQQMNRRDIDTLPPSPAGTSTDSSKNDTTSTNDDKHTVLLTNMNDTQSKLSKSIDKLLLTLDGGITINLDGKKVSSVLTNASNKTGIS